MKLITMFLCAIGRHEYERGIHFLLSGKSAVVKTCIHCKKWKFVT